MSVPLSLRPGFAGLFHEPGSDRVIRSLLAAPEHAWSSEQLAEASGVTLLMFEAIMKTLLGLQVVQVTGSNGGKPVYQLNLDSRISVVLENLSHECSDELARQAQARNR